MSISAILDKLADKLAYSSGSVSVRWGQLLRANSAIRNEQAQLSNKNQ